MSTVAERKNVGTVFSNIDNRLVPPVAKRLEEPGTQADHAAWDFCGTVYKANSKWVEEVWRHNRMVDRVEGDSLDEVIRQVNGIYGTD